MNFTKFEIKLHRSEYYIVNQYEWCDGKHTFVDTVVAFLTENQADCICEKMNELAAVSNKRLVKDLEKMEKGIQRTMGSMTLPKPREEAIKYLKKFSPDLFENIPDSMIDFFKKEN